MTPLPCPVVVRTVTTDGDASVTASWSGSSAVVGGVIGGVSGSPSGCSTTAVLGGSSSITRATMPPAAPAPTIASTTAPAIIALRARTASRRRGGLGGSGTARASSVRPSGGNPSWVGSGRATIGGRPGPRAGRGESGGSPSSSDCLGGIGGSSLDTRGVLPRPSKERVMARPFRHIPSHSVHRQRIAWPSGSGERDGPLRVPPRNPVSAAVVQRSYSNSPQLSGGCHTRATRRGSVHLNRPRGGTPCDARARPLCWR